MLSCGQLFVTPWTVAQQAPLSTGISQARILDWVAISFSRGSSGPRDQTQVFCLADRSFITEPPWKYENVHHNPFFFLTYIVYWLHKRWSYLIQGMSAKVGKRKRKRRRSKVLAAQLCMALWDSMDYSLPDSSVHGILQARILEWVYSLLQGIFLARGSNSCLLHCRQIFLPSQPPVK